MAKVKNKIKEKQELVEKMGVFFEQSGFAPMPGRVFAYLLLSEPAHKDFYEIQEFLSASKSAISNALKFLMERDMVKYLTFSGDRRRYFKVNMAGWLESNKVQIKRATIMKDIIEETLEHRAGSKDLAFNGELKSMIMFYTELAEVLDAFIEKWNKKSD